MISQAKENVGMAMIYTLVTSAKEWLIGKYGRTDNEGFDDDGEAQTKEEVILRLICVFVIIFFPYPFLF